MTAFSNWRLVLVTAATGGVVAGMLVKLTGEIWLQGAVAAACLVYIGRAVRRKKDHERITSD